MKTVLYHTDASPPSRAVKMMLYILGLEFEMQELNPLTTEKKSTEMKKKNPMRTIPFIEEGDFYLSDSHAIVLYLLEKYGKPEHEYLYPKEIRKRATVHQRLFFDCGLLFERLRAVMGPTYAGKMSEMTKEVIWGIKSAYSILEDYLSQTTYLADDNMTVADICAVSTVASLDGLYPVDELRYPKTKQWLMTMYEKDFCKVVNQPGCELHVAHLKAVMENNKYNKQAKLLEFQTYELSPLTAEKKTTEMRKGPTLSGKMTEMTKEVIWGIKSAYSILEDYLSQTTYLADNNMTVADICAVSTVSTLDGLYPVDEERYPKTKQWLMTMNEKDFCKVVNQPACELHAANTKALMENNKYKKQAKL